MFASALADLFQQQRERLHLVLDSDVVEAAFAALEKRNLSTEAIDKACCAELKIVLNNRHTVPMTQRLDKYGWSTKHIQDHMTQFLQARIRAAGRVLKAYVDDGLEADADEAMAGYDGTKHARLLTEDEFVQ